MLLLGRPCSAIGGPDAPPTPGTRDDTTLLRDVLEAAGRGYLEAKTALDKSQKRQAELAAELGTVESRHGDADPRSSRSPPPRTAPAGIGTASHRCSTAPRPDTFLDRAAALDDDGHGNDKRLRELNDAPRAGRRAKAAIDAEVAKQQKQLAVMAKRKSEAEKALALVGGSRPPAVRRRQLAGRPAGPAQRPTAPGRAESCSDDDPTTTGCITPRHAARVQQARRPASPGTCSCYRAGGPCEHPKGRACDFAAQTSGFGGGARPAATETYGNNLAAFFVRNADRLGVLYVIWYRQIWLPATGWRAYSAAGGDPSSDHTNHVHLSVL